MVHCISPHVVASKVISLAEIFSPDRGVLHHLRCTMPKLARFSQCRSNLFRFVQVGSALELVREASRLAGNAQVEPLCQAWPIATRSGVKPSTRPASRRLLSSHGKVASLTSAIRLRVSKHAWICQKQQSSSPTFQID